MEFIQKNIFLVLIAAVSGTMLLWPFSQARYADIKERVQKDGSRMLVVTTETLYTNQNGELLCILRASQIRR